MATHNAPALAHPLPAGATGKVNAITRSIVGNGKGGTVVAGDVLRMMKMPAFIRVHLLLLWTSATTASLTAKAGYADAEQGGTYSDDDAFIVPSTALATGGVRVMSNSLISAPELVKPTYLDIVTADATILATTTINATLFYEFMGTP